MRRKLHPICNEYLLRCLKCYKVYNKNNGKHQLCMKKRCKQCKVVYGKDEQHICWMRTLDAEAYSKGYPWKNFDRIVFLDIECALLPHEKEGELLHVPIMLCALEYSVTDLKQPVKRLEFYGNSLGYPEYGYGWHQCRCNLQHKCSECIFCECTGSDCECDLCVDVVGKTLTCACCTFKVDW